MRKKKSAPVEKPAAELTTDEVISRLFPKPVVDAARRAVEPSEKPPKLPMSPG